MLVLGTPELAGEVLHAPPGTYLAGAANRRILPVLPQNTLLTLDGEAHRERRRELAPLFHGDSLESITPVIRDLTSRELESWPVAQPFATLPRMRRVTLSVAARLILGVSDGTEIERLKGCLARMLNSYPMLAGWAALAYLGPASPQATARRQRRAFGRCLAAAVGSDQLQLGADEVFALLLAGHETTATALAWAIHELARAPEIADALAGESPAGDRPWLDAVIHETLRLHPPLIDIVRQPSEAVELADRDVPAGTLLLIPPPLIHRSATSVEPARFKPERFLRRRPDLHTWIPFGGGERRCLGASLAMLELREVLPRIVTRFELRPVREEPERVRLYGTAIPPGKGAKVVFAPRRVALTRRAPSVERLDKRASSGRGGDDDLSAVVGHDERALVQGSPESDLRAAGQTCRDPEERSTSDLGGDRPKR